MTLELIEQHPSGEVGFEGTAWVSKTTGSDDMTSAPGRGQRPDPHRELLRLLR